MRLESCFCVKRFGGVYLNLVKKKYNWIYSFYFLSTGIIMPIRPPNVVWRSFGIIKTLYFFPDIMLRKYDIIGPILRTKVS